VRLLIINWIIIYKYIILQYKNLNRSDFLKSYLTIKQINTKKQLKYLRSGFDPKKLV
jgi:hypothetical protein